MSINFLPAVADKEHSTQIESLYENAFPKSERAPFWFLRHKAKQSDVSFSSLYEDESWIGLIYMSEYEDILLVLYFAIDASCRSGGYGTKVLTALREDHPDKRIVLTIEPIDEQADNYERSEEHTSELQSRPHISYAVFCLKKKKSCIITQYTFTFTPSYIFTCRRF